MKAHIKIPLGWRRLRVGERICNGDRYFLRQNGASSWQRYLYAFGELQVRGEFAIRRIARKRKWCPKGYVEVTGLEWFASELPNRAFLYTVQRCRRVLTYDEWRATGLGKGKTRFFKPIESP